MPSSRLVRRPSVSARWSRTRTHPGFVESGCALDSLSLRMSYSENRFPLFRDMRQSIGAHPQDKTRRGGLLPLLVAFGRNVKSARGYFAPLTHAAMAFQSG